MKRSLEGTRVLFVCPPFFGYDEEIADELKRRGAVVDHLIDRPFKSAYMKAFAKVLPAAASLLAARKYGWVFGAQKPYDLVFVVNGQTLSSRFLRRLRHRFPRADFVLYLWDSFKNRPSAKANMPLFDCVLGFDRKDAHECNFTHRPLFFGRRFEIEQRVKSDIDVSFIGTIHTDRWQVIHRLDSVLPSEVNRLWYPYLPARWVFWLFRLIFGNLLEARVTDFKYVPLSKDNVGDIFSRSRVILDIEHLHQRGLTIRTIEAVLGAGKKLITTNPEIIEYDFYDSENIMVIDRSAPQPVPVEFFKSVPRPTPATIRERYSIKGWLDEILEELEKKRQSGAALPVR